MLHIADQIWTDSGALVDAAWDMVDAEIAGLLGVQSLPEPAFAGHEADPSASTQPPVNPAPAGHSASTRATTQHWRASWNGQMSRILSKAALALAYAVSLLATLIVMLANNNN